MLVCCISLVGRCAVKRECLNAHCTLPPPSVMNRQISHEFSRYVVPLTLRKMSSVNAARRAAAYEEMANIRHNSEGTRNDTA